MSITCTNCGTENMAPGLCQRCGQRLPQVCPQCGTINKPTVQYCGGCGYQFAPAPAPAVSQDRTVQQGSTVAYNPGPQPTFPPYTSPGPGPAPQQPGPMNPPPFTPPQFTPPYVQPQPPKSGGRVWKMISGVLGGIIVVFGLGIWLLVKLAPDTPAADTTDPKQTDTTQPDTAQGQDPKNTPAPPQQPAQNKNTGLEVEPGKFANVKVVAQGDFQRTFSVIDARAGLVAAGKGNSAQLYQVKSDGSMGLIKDITPDNVGNLLHVHVGDMLNSGTAGLVAVYEKAIYFVDVKGTPTGYKATVQDAIVADVDGDGKFETLLQQDAGDGTHTIVVVRFSGEEVEQVASVKKQPAQSFDFAGLTLNKKALLFNAQGTDKGIQFTLYTWDNTKGVMQLVQHLSPADPNHPGEWAASGTFGAAGSAFVVSRSGSPATIEVIEVDQGGAKSIGAVSLPGTGRYQIVLASLTSDTPSLLAIDENGHYYIIGLQ